MSKTPYSEGFIAGIRYQRENILDYITVHLDQGIQVTALDIVDEINGQHKRDMNAKIQEMRELWDRKN
jgi:hypothetical protein